MALPTTRAEFKSYCLRALGEPVIEVNVADDQVNDRIDEALRYYWDYHFDGSSKTYYKHLVTEQDKTNGYITLPENVMGVVRIFEYGTFRSMASNMFSAEYQFALNDLYEFTRVTLVPYYMVRTQLSLIEQLLVGQKPIRYNRHTDRLYVDMDWNRMRVGDYLLVEAYEVIDPDVYSDAWSDRWLLEYATQKIKSQWGTNMKKFEGVQLIGGLTFSGQKIYEEAELRIRELEHEMINSYSIPVADVIG